MLFDLNGTMAENARGVTKNFAEGRLLNNVVRSTSAQGAIANWTTAQFGKGLTGEVSNHLIGGLGFSAVRTGFDSRTWLDDKGEVSLQDGAIKFALGTTAGALFNVPAGMVGLRVAKAATMGLADGVVSRIAAGSASGAMSGGVYGFTDSLVQSNSFVEAGRGFVEGFVVGAFAGGATAGLMRAPRDLPQVQRSTLYDSGVSITYKQTPTGPRTC